jgi:hypothetical protein
VVGVVYGDSDYREVLVVVVYGESDYRDGNISEILP